MNEIEKLWERCGIKKQKFTLEHRNALEELMLNKLGVVKQYKNKYGYYGYDYSEINGNGLTRDKALCALINQLIDISIINITVKEVKDILCII